MRAVLTATLLLAGLTGLAMAQDNAAGTANGTFQNPKPGGTLFGALFGDRSDAPPAKPAPTVRPAETRETRALRAILGATSLDQAKQLAAQALR